MFLQWFQVKTCLLYLTDLLFGAYAMELVEFFIVSKSYCDFSSFFCLWSVQNPIQLSENILIIPHYLPKSLDEQVSASRFWTVRSSHLIFNIDCPWWVTWILNFPFHDWITFRVNKHFLKWFVMLIEYWCVSSCILVCKQLHNPWETKSLNIFIFENINT